MPRRLALSPRPRPLRARGRSGGGVSLRLVMYSAALAPHLAHLDRRWRALLAFVMTDQSFAMTVARFGEPGERSERHWYFLGSAAMLYTSWQLAVLVGVVAGARGPAGW